MELLQAMQQRQAVGLHGAGVASRECPHLTGCSINPCLQSLLGFLDLEKKKAGRYKSAIWKRVRLARCLSVFQLLHLLQRLLETLQTGPQVHRDQLSDAFSVVIDDVPRGAAVVIAVQRGGTLQAHGEVAGLAEEPELLARV